MTANQVTIAAVVLSVAGGASIAFAPDARWPLVLMPIILLLRMALNAVDGMLAREFGQKSRLGAMLNEIGDVVSDAALYLPLALIAGVNQWAFVAFVIAAVIVEFAGVAAIQIGASRRYDGPMGKSDRAFWVGLLAVLLATKLITPAWATYYAWGLAILSVLTVIRRTRRALAEDEKKLAPNSSEGIESEPCSVSNANQPIVTVTK